MRVSESSSQVDTNEVVPGPVAKKVPNKTKKMLLEKENCAFQLQPQPPVFDQASKLVDQQEHPPTFVNLSVKPPKLDQTATTSSVKNNQKSPSEERALACSLIEENGTKIINFELSPSKPKMKLKCNKLANQKKQSCMINITELISD